MRVGVIGLGTMGAPLARHLLAAGHELTVHNRTRERELPLAELGAGRASSPAEAARQAEAVLTCLSDTPDVDAVVFGREGVAAGLARGSGMGETRANSSGSVGSGERYDPLAGGAAGDSRIAL
jgi:3-hydroxyisobutyrate dehydrogenase